MADVNKQSVKRQWRGLILMGLTLLSGIFAWLTYREVLFLGEAWRWQRNILIELKIGFRVLLLLVLTVGSAVGPAVFLMRQFRPKKAVPLNADQPNVSDTHHGQPKE